MGGRIMEALHNAHIRAWVGHHAKKFSRQPIADGYQPKDLHEYTDNEGNPTHWRIRLKHPDTGDKWIRPMRREGAGFVLKESSFPNSRPLYRLHELASRPHEPVIVVEGEVCADVLLKLGILATTSGAADSAGKVDWSILYGGKVTIWPDNDEAGQRYALAVKEKLSSIGCKVAIIDVSKLGLPFKGDCVDWLATHPEATVTEILALPKLAEKNGPPESTARDDHASGDTQTLPETEPAGEYASDVNLLRASDVILQPITWLWNGWLAAGKMHVFGGAPGTGKTTISMGLAATVTTGGLWPDGGRSIAGNVVIWSGEDDPSDTLTPRLALSGADLSRVYFITDIREGNERRSFDPARDMEPLRRKLAEVGGVRLLIVDPIVSAVAGDSHKNAEVRRSLQPLADLAKEMRCALLGITHFSKGTGGRDPVERLTGSLAFGALARVVLVAAKHQEEGDDGRTVRLFCRAKSNIGPDVFGELASVMRKRGNDAQQVAHFLIQCLFCMFAEDEGLLHEGTTENQAIFTRILKSVGNDLDRASDKIAQLFAAMQKKKGQYGDDYIAWFNGGLFKTIDIPILSVNDLTVLRKAAEEMDWRAIDPTIFGTLFERGLDPKARAPLGAHYTDADTIGKLIKPLITEPLQAEWAVTKSRIIESLTAASRLKDAKTRKKHRADATTTYQTYLERLRNFQVLDPACGSGNFLYLALRVLKDLEQQAQNEAETIGLQRQLSIETGPHNILGIEINEYAAELARATVWIGDIQWSRENGREIARNPILKSLDSIEHRDALLNPDGSEAKWPQADVIVGNPPFLGDKIMRSELGDDYVERLRKCYAGRVPGGADLVTYWFEKSRAQIADGKAQAVGLVATNSIRQKRNRVVLERILESTRIFEAWSDEDWVNDGAAVRVSLVCFGHGRESRLDGHPVAAIHSDLSGSVEVGQILDLTQAIPLVANKDRSYFGLCLAGPFKVDTATALQWLKAAGNPNGRPNSDVVRPIYNGSDITRRWAGNWVVDFAGREMADAADYISPFAYVEKGVKPVRAGNREAVRAEKWWHHGRRRPTLRAALHGLTHYIATPETAKHRFFVKFPVQVAPEHSLIVIPRQDNATLGILSSRIHCVWALAKGGRMGLGNDPRYNASLTFETFPFPQGFDFNTKAEPDGKAIQAIAQAAADLNDWREKWLNPEGWLDWAQTAEEKAAGFPPRSVPKPEHAAAWKKRTLTNLYNEMPSGLRLRQEKLDKAVAASYGWKDYTPDMTDSEILLRLLALNLERTGN